MAALTRENLARLTASERWTPGDEAPLCYLCGQNRVEIDWEGPGTSMSPVDKCSRCFWLGGYRTHVHVERLTARQAEANDCDPQHTWSTSQVMRPRFEDGQHVGYVCGDEDCTYVERVDEPGSLHELAELLRSDAARAATLLADWATQAVSFEDFPGSGLLRAAGVLLETAENPLTGTRARPGLLEQAAVLAAQGRRLK